MLFARKFSGGPLVQERALLELRVSDFKNTPTTWWFKEGHSWSIAVTQLSSVLRLHSNTSDLMLLKATTEPAGPFGTMPYEPWHSEKGAKPDCIIQLNCGEVCTHASYKTTRTWENFNNQGTKMILLSDELWLITNNSKSFANRSKSIIRNNLGSWKHSEIYLI